MEGSNAGAATQMWVGNVRSQGTPKKHAQVTHPQASAPEGQLVITLCSVAGMLCATGRPPFSAN